MNYEKRKKYRVPNAVGISGTIKVPGSKSLTNRALMLSCLGNGTCELTGFLHAEDTQLMAKAWTCLGAQISGLKEESPTVVVTGINGKPRPYQRVLFAGNAGTVARFLIPSLCLGTGTYKIDGDMRMRERPLAELIESLKVGGCKIHNSMGEVTWPINVSASGFAGGFFRISCAKSSQFASALMISAPYGNTDTKIFLEGTISSKPYIRMTKKIMNDFGVLVDWSDNTIEIPSDQFYQCTRYHIEGDASSASYFFAAAAIVGGAICIEGIPRNSLQGDLQFLDVLEKMGCSVHWEADSVRVTGGELRGVEVDMRGFSDVAPTLAIVAVFAKGRTIIHGIEAIRDKECNRMGAIVAELRKVGVSVEEHADTLVISQSNDTLQGSEIETYNDHRIAMSMAILGLKVPKISILNPSCVKKTYPNFFKDLESIVIH